MSRLRSALLWAILVAAIVVPIIAAAASPLLAWRSPIYISAGFAGIIAMALLLVQPLLIGGYLPGFSGQRGRRLHRFVGAGLVIAVAIHVLGLWLTSPPDVVDALLFASPTPFSDWGVIAMWAVIGTAVLAVFRRRLRLRVRTWRLAHLILAVIIAVCSVVHALLIEGTMETISKVALCALVVLAVAKIAADLRVWAIRRS